MGTIDVVAGGGGWRWRSEEGWGEKCISGDCVGLGVVVGEPGGEADGVEIAAAASSFDAVVVMSVVVDVVVAEVVVMVVIACVGVALDVVDAVVVAGVDVVVVAGVDVVVVAGSESGVVLKVGLV